VVTPERIRILVDTNILLRAIQHENPLCAVARKALKTLHRQNRQLCLTPQNVREFWNVCTRPTDHNGLGISVSGTERHARFLE
jgi:predicted nucleic acid-binding protein